MAVTMQPNLSSQWVNFIRNMVFKNFIESDNEYDDEVFENVEEELIEDLEEEEEENIKNKERKVKLIKYNPSLNYKVDAFIK